MGRLEYIKNNLHKTDEQLAEDLDISRAYVVAIRQANDLNKKAEWTDEDDAWLRNNYPTAPWPDIFDRFPDKTKIMIKTRAYSMGVYRDKSYSWSKQ